MIEVALRNYLCFSKPIKYKIVHTYLLNVVKYRNCSATLTEKYTDYILSTFTLLEYYCPSLGLDRSRFNIRDFAMKTFM